LYDFDFDLDVVGLFLGAYVVEVVGT